MQQRVAQSYFEHQSQTVEIEILEYPGITVTESEADADMALVIQVASGRDFERTW